MINVMIFD